MLDRITTEVVGQIFRRECENDVALEALTRRAARQPETARTDTHASALLAIMATLTGIGTSMRGI